ncbi:DUF397 domain-containing protein [Streptomyces sp. NBC_01768]|uniref:DUF397 domain-containing protein n=1 Tax=Streptomyces sp. NBC_01768 TaxID=2975938 RepID=UPI002DD93BEB|nr:DUF397 domain-containing protein [Streptomyces sp. NBC_01768]WSC32130.1 DUF397 domain-containing protein [Streptomyces sp. NBC_01768]
MQFENGVSASGIPGVTWVKASASQGVGNCVEVADLGGGEVAVRHSRFPDGPALVFSDGEFSAFLDGAKGSEFDHMTA